MAGFRFDVEISTCRESVNVLHVAADSLEERFELMRRFAGEIVPAVAWAWHVATHHPAPA